MRRVTDVADYIGSLQERFIASAVQHVRATFLLTLTGEGGGVWTIKIWEQVLTVEEGQTVPKPDARFTMDAAEWLKMANGDICGANAYNTGVLSSRGNLTLAYEFAKALPPIRG